jgi:NAD(P)-dependent dehydrogenase (short-subunit alcohol dehydrogenase family)
MLITGANRGIGLETARQLARRGCHVVLASRNEESGRQAAQAISTDSGKATFLALDVRRSDSLGPSA